ncbi:MAG: hypothetical protein JRI68_12555 [Deltaproteobacteria bacterium]|nr:hypothetical protein [Deltaproteobacteria bacterium]
MRRWLPHIGIVAGLCLAIYALFFGSSDEDEIRELLERLEEAVAVREGNTNILVRAAHVKKEFSEIFIKEVTFQIPELSRSPKGRQELAGLAANAPRLWATATVDLGGLSVEVDDAGVSGVAYGKATLTATRLGGQLERDDRTVSLRLDKVDGDWLIVHVSVSPKLSTEESP